MGEEQGQGRTQLDATSDGSRSSDEIRAEIEETRRQLGDTVAAVAEKADVKAQAQAKVAEARQRVIRRTDNLAARTKAAVPDSGATFAARAKVVAEDNWIALIAIGAFATGVVVGRSSASRGLVAR